MKNLSTFVLFITMIILLAIVIIFGMTIYLNAVSTYTVTEISYENDTIIEEEVIKEKTENKGLIEFRNKVNNMIYNIFNKEDVEEPEFEIAVLQENYFYNQLNDNQKKIYTALQNNKENLMRGNYIIEFGNAFYDILSQENGSEILGNDYQSAIEAFTHDNPDIFYLDVNKMYINIVTTKKITGVTYNVYIGPEDEGNYFVDGFYTYEGVLEDKQKIEQERDKIINSLTGTTYQKIRTIHDYLINNIQYDSNYISKGKYTVYGAFVDKMCVCEGYAKTFKYLANAAGINCEILQGKSTNSYGEVESHAWNCVQIENTWYQVDVTWDDPIILGSGKLTNKSKYRYFLKGTKTFEIDHEIKHQFTDRGKIFDYPDLSASDYN